MATVIASSENVSTDTTPTEDELPSEQQGFLDPNESDSEEDEVKKILESCSVPRIVVSSQESYEEGSSVEGSVHAEWNRCTSMEEPELEFDEMGLELAASAELEAEEELIRKLRECYIELAKEEEGGVPFRSGAITPDGLIDEDFEEELGSPSQDDEQEIQSSDFRDIAKYGIIQVAGDDSFGRKVIVFSNCRLPPHPELDHGRLLQYMRHTLDQYVENDYTLVYFHFGLSSKNKPSFSWLRQAYRDFFDRKYKKNMKALYLVHPTNLIKVLWGLFRPIISVKFGKKVMYVNYLHELENFVHLDQLMIPQRVKDHDSMLVAKNKPKPPVQASTFHTPLPTQQFGVSLQYIKEHNGNQTLPIVPRLTIVYLREHGLETEGIFRRSANASILRDLQNKFNTGQEVDFSQLVDVHIPAAMLKSFLRQLPEPVLTFDLYDHIIRIQSIEKTERLAEMKRLLMDELPEDNYNLLKFVIQFLTEVMEKSSVNKMTDVNLAIVFGPNLLWSKNQASLTSMGYVNSCAQLLLCHYDELFVK